jgi:hypothetical protein
MRLHGRSAAIVLLGMQWMDTWRWHPAMNRGKHRVPLEGWRKSSQWMGLIREHAELFVHDKVINELFEAYCSPSNACYSGKIYNLQEHLTYALCYTVYIFWGCIVERRGKYGICASNLTCVQADRSLRNCALLPREFQFHIDVSPSRALVSAISSLE